MSRRLYGASNVTGASGIIKQVLDYTISSMSILGYNGGFWELSIANDCPPSRGGCYSVFSDLVCRQSGFGVKAIPSAFGEIDHGRLIP